MISACLSAQKANDMESWSYPYEVNTILVEDSIELAYVDEGEGEHVYVFIHGLGSNLQAWKKNIDVIDGQARCVALDLPGYGKSGQGSYSFTMPFFARVVEKFIEGLDLQNVILVGHSMGGQIAMHVALTQPEWLDRMILCAPAGIEVFSEGEATWMKNLYTSHLVKSTPDAQIIKNFEINFYDMPDDARFMIDQRFEMKKDSQAYDYYCDMIPRCMAGMLDGPVINEVKKIQVPVDVIYGENDFLIPNSFLHKTLKTRDILALAGQSFSDVRTHLFPQAGHFVQWEASDSVNEVLLGKTTDE